MTAKIIDGKAVAQDIRGKLKQEIDHMINEQGMTPGLAVVLVGNNPASEAYVNMKAKACQELGMYSEKHHLEADTTEQALLDLIEKLNGKADIHGILVQLPLPEHIDTTKVILTIDPKKDVDGFHPINTGNFHIGIESFIPCTPYGVLKLIETTGLDIAGKDVTVVGASNLVGKPAAMLMLQEGATVTLCHKMTHDLALHTQKADILILAAGCPGLITAGMVKEGACVIDVGTTKVAGKLKGDVDFETVKEKAGWITPVPGGVGPMTITMLLYNTVQAVKQAT